MANRKIFLLSQLILVFFSGTECYGSDFDRCPLQSRRGGSLKTYNNKCYQFIPTEVYWHEGRQYCRNRGGDLITIHRRDIQAFVERSLREINWRRNGIWIGATDMHNERDWKWVSGQSVASGYQNWEGGQPSCNLLDFMCLEDCACLRLDEGYRWHDYFCAAKFFEYGFICQYDMLPPTTPPNEPATLKISGGNLTSTRETATTTPQRPSEPATLKISGSNISSTRESTSTTTSTVTTSPEPVWVTLKDRKPTVVEGHYAKSDADYLCHYGNKTYKSGDKFPDLDGCNVCHCYNGYVGCTEMACLQGGTDCYYGNVLYKHGAKFKDTDDCSWCECVKGQVNCRKMDCNSIDNQKGVHSQQVALHDEGMKTGSVVWMVVSFVLVFVAGIVIGLFVCRRRYQKHYEETASAGFSNILYTAAPQQTDLKQTNLYLSEPDSDLDEDPPHYTSIDNICVPPSYSEAAATGSSIYADIAEVAEVKKVMSGEAERENESEEGALNVKLPPVPCRSGMSIAPDIQSDRRQQPADGISEAYSNNLYSVQ